MKPRAEYVIPIVFLVFVLIFSLCQSCNNFIHSNGEGYENYNDDKHNYANYAGAGKTQAAGAPTPENQNQSRKEEFSTLNSVSAAYGKEAPIDIYSQAEGSPTCEPGSYSNSKGYLCLNENQKKQLLTRGMNQSEGASQIGQA